MTVDEERNKLDDDIRRLKIEYETYFSGGSPRPPHDTLYRVENTIKRYSSDQSKLNFGHRYRLNNLIQKYAINAQLWRRRLQEREEGRSLTGPKHRVELRAEDGAVCVVLSDPDVEREEVSRLMEAMQEARRRAGETAAGVDAAAFHKFIKAKTQQVKSTLGCDKVQFSVSVEGGRFKFKARKAQ